MTKNLLILLLLISTSACTKTTFVRSAPDYTDSLAKARVTLLLPPTVEVNQVDAWNKKTRMNEYEDHLEEIIIDTFITRIEEKGYRVKLLSRKEIADNKVSSHYVDTKDNFEDVLKEFYHNGAWEEKLAYSIDHKLPSSTELGKKVGADLLVMINFYAESKTSGAMTKDLAMTVLKAALIGRARSDDKSEFSRIRLAILDVETGRVLWAHSVSTSNNMFGTTYNSFSDSATVDRNNLTILFNMALADLPPAK